MSRRRKLPELPEGYIRTFTAAIVCTDRGQHPRAGIASVSGANVAGQGDPALIWEHRAKGKHVEAWMAADGWRTYTFDCRRCGRHLPIREPRLMVAVKALDAGDGRPVVDISMRGLS